MLLCHGCQSFTFCLFFIANFAYKLFLSTACRLISYISQGALLKSCGIFICCLYMVSSSATKNFALLGSFHEMQLNQTMLHLLQIKGQSYQTKYKTSQKTKGFNQHSKPHLVYVFDLEAKQDGTLVQHVTQYAFFITFLTNEHGHYYKACTRGSIYIHQELSTRYMCHQDNLK